MKSPQTVSNDMHQQAKAAKSTKGRFILAPLRFLTTRLSSRLTRDEP
jgi:hypothetical protein